MTTEYILKIVAVPLMIFWLIGYLAHKQLRPEQADIRLPLIARLFFGNPRADGTLSTAGICAQLFGYTNATTWVLVGMRLIDRETGLYAISSEALLLSLWFIWTQRSGQGAERRPDIGIDYLKMHRQWETNTHKQQIPLAVIRPERNWWVIGFVVFTFSVFALMALWLLWFSTSRLLQLLSTGLMQSSYPSVAVFVLLDILTLVGILFAIFPVVSLLDIRIDTEGIRVLTLAGYRCMRWSAVTEAHVRARDQIVLVSRDQTLSITLLTFKSPESVIAEIEKRISARGRDSEQVSLS
ncbi:MAG: hypothetical protein HY868_22200 [Chloroflexi bacterium]|nr:hypothetical protein [Chloroflexota bacterium]